MPFDFLHIDTGFPTAAGQDSTENKVEAMRNYLYILLEQLRYTLSNLDATNMNATALQDYSNSITEPIYMKLSDDEGSITQLQTTAQGLTASIQNNTGAITELRETVDGFTLSASNGGTSSVLSLKSGGVTLSSAAITFTGAVTFQDLAYPGATVISGDNITTGTISAVTMQGNTISGGTITGATLRSISDQDGGFELYDGAVMAAAKIGGLRYDDNGTGDDYPFRMYLYTVNNWVMKLLSSGSMSIDADTGHTIFIGTTCGGQTIRIGREDAAVNLVGAVSVNGVPLGQ